MAPPPLAVHLRPVATPADHPRRTIPTDPHGWEEGAVDGYSARVPTLPLAYRWALGAFLVVLLATWWRPPHPGEQALHHSLTVLGLAVLLVVQRRRLLPYTSFLLILIFLVLHSVAARWMYSFVPYDDWTDALFGVRLNEVFGWERNNFDRLVHLSYGLCFGPVLLARFRAAGRSLRWSAVAAVDVVLSTSAIYELFEWGIAMTLAPGAAEAYNGQQGDMWDAQKDMTLATTGAVIAVTIAVLAARRRRVPALTSRAAGD
jgi:putative membrane protein